MRIGKLLLFLFATSCSTLSQNLESPVVVEKKKWGLGGGAVFGHNMAQNDLDHDELEVSKVNYFLAGRYSPLKNVEVGVSGGSLGLDRSSGLDFRVRYQWWGGWVDPFNDFDDSDDEEDETPIAEKPKKGAKGQIANRAKSGQKKGHKEKESREIDDSYLDQVPHVPDGWISTAALGFLTADNNRLEESVSNELLTSFYVSNSVGYKQGPRVYYFGAKIINMDYSYSFKIDRQSDFKDIDMTYSKVTFGLFAGITYTRVSTKKHQYIIDLMFSFLQLPKGAQDQGDSYYPSVTIAGWYVD